MPVVKRKYNPYKHLLPEGTAEIIEKFCDENSAYKKPERDYFKYIYIIDTITRDVFDYLSKGKKYRDYKGCPLHMETLASIIGTNDSDALTKIKNLTALGIIKRVGGYRPGGNSYHYILQHEPKQFAYVIALPKFTNITNKIIEKRNTNYAENIKELKLYKKFLQRITLRLTKGVRNFYPKPIPESEYISENKLSEYQSGNTEDCGIACSSSPMILDFEENSLEHFVTKAFKKSEKDKNVSKYVSIEKAVNANIQSLQAIIDGDWYVHRINNKSRVYTNLTNLKREFRKLLRCDNKFLIELDIRNSQPLIATILIKNYWMEKGCTMPIDVSQYQKDCEAGVFYDYFMQLNNIEDDDDVVRSEFKVQLFAEVFFSKVSKRKTDLKTQFMQKYPSVYEAICSIKGGLGSMEYNRFAILLQRKEADIIWDDVNVSLINDGIPAFNVFDSILCLLNYKEIARERIMNAFAKYDLIPTINYKNVPENRYKALIEKIRYTMSVTNDDNNYDYDDLD